MKNIATYKRQSNIDVHQRCIKMLNRLFALIAISLMSSCINDGLVNQHDITNNDQDQEVIFKVNIPYATNQTSTRAISENNENRINSIYILAFKVNPDGSETFDYYSEATLKSSGSNETKNQYYTVKVRVKKYQQRFVAITNAKEQVNSFAGNKHLVGQPKEEILSKLEVYLSPNEKWNTSNSDDYKAFPMWGESSIQTITSTTKDLSGKIALMRMLARINVQLDNSISAIGRKFKIKSVRVYNTNTKGVIVPNSNTIEEEVRDGNRYTFVKGVTIPSDIKDDSKRQFGPLKYTDFTSPGVVDMAMTGAIYIFETKAPTSQDMLKATSLVIGGWYGNDTKETYYRVDFLGPDRKTFLDVKRNHRYLVNIVNIKGQGHETPEDAFESKSANMETEILFWNEGDIGDWVFGEHYNLGVGFTEYELDKNAKSNILQRISTNAPDGWKYKLKKSRDKNSEDVPSTSWIRVLRRTNNGSGLLDELYFEVDKNITGYERSAYMHITAHNFTVVVPIKQKVTESFYLNMTPKVDYFDFNSGTSVNHPIESKSVLLDWGPAGVDIQWAIKSISSTGLSFNHATNGVMSNGTGSINITPTKFTLAELEPNSGGDPFLSKESRLEVTLENDNGGIIKKTIGLRQKNYTAITDAKDFYVLDGKKHSFIVKANTPWTAKLLSVGGNGASGGSISSLITTEGVGDTTIGETISFIVVDDLKTLEMKSSIIRISSVEGKFDDIDVYITGGPIIWVGPDGYIPASTSSDMVFFNDAQAACPEGYIVPTRLIMGEWLKSVHPMPTGGDHWINEYGYRNVTEREAEGRRERLLELILYATTINEGNAYNYLQHARQIWSGPREDSKLKVVFTTDRVMGNKYKKIEEFEREGGVSKKDAPNFVEPISKARVRCVKKVATRQI